MEYESVRGWGSVDVWDGATEMLNEFCGNDACLDPGAPDFYFDDTFGETFVSDDHLEWSTNEIGIIEFDAGPIVTVIPEDFEARGL